MSAHGSGLEAAWDGIAAGTPAGISWTPDGADTAYLAAPVPDSYRPNPQIPRNLVHFMDRGALLAVDAALQALESAGLGAGAGDARRFAVADGLAYRAPGQPTLFVPYGHQIARALGVRGPVVTVGNADASGMSAIAEAARIIARNEADVVIAGAAQTLQPAVLDHLRGTGASTRSVARPLDAAGNGMVPGEGAAYFVVESEAHAAARGAKALARIAGIGATFDATVEPLETSDSREAGRAQQLALGNAGYLQNQVDHIVTCADGRPAVNAAEATGIMRTFGRHAYYASVGGVMGTMGNTLAASGPLSIAYALETMRRGRVLPLTGFETALAGVELTYPAEAKDERIECVLVTCLGLGGNNIAVLLQS